MSRSANQDMQILSDGIDEELVPEKIMQTNDGFYKIQVEKMRLMFLVSCKALKRPPPTLRFNGCLGLHDDMRIKLISEMESKSLNKAIVEKKKQIKVLESIIKTTKKSTGSVLTKQKRKKIQKKFNRKINFYKKQDEDKWKNWPCKDSKKITKKKTNASKTKKNLKRKFNQIKKEANNLLKNGSVRVLMELDVPPEAIAVLGKGLGFVPTPKEDDIELRLEARRCINNIINDVNKHAKMEELNSEGLEDVITSNDDLVSSSFSLPSKLRQVSYFQKSLNKPNAERNFMVQKVKENLNSLKYKKSKQIKRNLSFFERKGLDWLSKKVMNEEIFISEADKGGAILIVSKYLLEEKMKQKLENPLLYKMLSKDPRKEIYDEMICLWKNAKQNNYVSEIEAQEIVGITKNNNKSSAARFKPGRTYFRPSLKIHKLKPEDLKPGCDIPIRLITCLQQSVTSRSDIYSTRKWLKELEKDYCSDLVKDTNQSLLWLKNMNDVMSLSESCVPFTFDFDSLYDSISPDLVLRALKDAISMCRSEWDDGFCNWLCDIISLSMNASVGEFNGVFFKQLRGIATGGSNCVELANITVYFVLKNVVYDRPEMMNGIVGIKRFIDDGCGIHRMSVESFKQFMIDVSNGVKLYGLKIKESDWSVSESPSIPIHFLDIKIYVNKDNKIITTLYRKPTDSRRYLNFKSCHPNHVFSGVVYSQGLRLRRIIECDEDLQNELSYLKEDFLKSQYPSKMIDNIFEKVQNMNRVDLLRKKTNDDFSNQNDKIMLISTFGRNKPLIDATRKIEKKFPSLKFQTINKTASSLRNMLEKTKNISLGPQKGKTEKCNRRRCKSCALMSEKNFITCKNTKRKYFSSFGSCLSKNTIYNAECKHCGKMYVGKSTQSLCDRISGHRSLFYDCISKNGNINNKRSTNEDEYILGMHLYKNHGLSLKEAFNQSYVFTVLQVCSPKNIDVQEHKWIQKLKSVAPYGLNSHDPFGISIKY